MGITGEILFRDFKSFTSADIPDQFYQLTNAGGGQGRSVTTFNIINNDTVEHKIDVVLEVFNGVSWLEAASNTYRVLADDTAIATEFIVPLLPGSGDNHDRIMVKVGEEVGPGKTIHIFCSGAQFV